MNRVTVGLGAAALLSTTLASAATATAVTPQLAGPCAHVPRCHVVGHANVDGRGGTDTVAIAVTSRYRGQLRVSLSDGTMVARPVKVSPYASSIRRAYAGVGRMDGVKGAEILFVVDAGAHTTFYRAYTMRGAGLVRLSAPGRRQRWISDGSVTSSFGHRRLVRDGHVVVKKRSARSRDGRHYRSVVTRYVWRDGRWDRTGAVRSRIGAKKASSYSGFRGQFGRLGVWPA